LCARAGDIWPASGAVVSVINHSVYFLSISTANTLSTKRNNQKLLYVLFNQAGLPESKYDLQYEDFTPDERHSLIEAFMQYKAVAAIMPESFAFN
jgi:hypothetical protein